MPSSSPRLIAIGDIHGCSEALAALIDAIEPQPEDRIVTLGDYIDRGPDSHGVLEQLIALGKQCELIPILGNHEEMLLGGLRGKSPWKWWLQHGGKETYDSYGCDGDYSIAASITLFPSEHIAFLDACHDYYEAEDHFFTHANYVASAPLSGQPIEALRWQDLNEHSPARHVSGKTAFVGHTSQHDGEVLDLGHLKCIDTYCYGGGWLTAYDVMSGEVWQASVDGELCVGEPRA